MDSLVVFIAGAGQSADVWDEQVRLLGPTAMTLSVSATDLVASEFAFDEAVTGLHSAIEETTATSIVLVGLSIGGMIATRYAASYPERVAGVLLSGSQIRPHRLLMHLQKAVLRAVPARVLGLPESLSKRAFLGMLNEVSDADLRADVARITVPATVLCGSKDRANLPAARALAAQLPDAQLRIIQGGGHELATHRPNEFSQSLRHLLVRISHLPEQDSPAR